MANEVRKHRTPSGHKIVRGMLMLFGGIIGYFVAFVLLQRGILVGPSDEYLIALAAALTTYLTTKPLAAILGNAWNRFILRLAEIPADVVFAAGVGATGGLLLTVLLTNLLSQTPLFTWYFSLLLATILVAGTSGFFVNNRHLFPFMPKPELGDVREGSIMNAKVLDSSALIDGRIPDLVAAHFIQGTVIVPTFVLTELQRIADSSDPLRRQRGRRALETIDELVALVEGTNTSVVIRDAETNGLPVDEALIRLCLSIQADLITTDYNLDKIAAVQGVTTLNLHRLATAMKPAMLAGERVMLHITREGREAGQGLAYLEDGTMVVVENTADEIGNDIEAIITSNIQTAVGRMIFAKPAQIEGDIETQAPNA